jgi:hypothetical protein
MLFKVIITVYSENRTKYMNTLCEKNSESVNVIAGATPASEAEKLTNRCVPHRIYCTLNNLTL